MDADTEHLSGHVNPAYVYSPNRISLREARGVWAALFTQPHQGHPCCGCTPPRCPLSRRRSSEKGCLAHTFCPSPDAVLAAAARRRACVVRRLAVDDQPGEAALQRLHLSVKHWAAHDDEVVETRQALCQRTEVLLLHRTPACACVRVCAGGGRFVENYVRRVCGKYVCGQENASVRTKHGRRTG